MNGAWHSLRYGNIRPIEWLNETVMSQRAMLYRRPSEPQAIEVIFDAAIYIVRLLRDRLVRLFLLRTCARAPRLGRLPEWVRFADGIVVPLRGTPHRIVHRPGSRGTVWIEPDSAEEPLICVAGQAPHVDRRIGDFLRREARRDLEAASLRFAASLGVTVKRLAVRDQASRWGSCSSTGVLSYSWRLILAPPFVLNYLAAHEVAHLAEMNHSARFWRLVQRLCPDHQRARVWLDVDGSGSRRSGLAEA